MFDLDAVLLRIHSGELTGFETENEYQELTAAFKDEQIKQTVRQFGEEHEGFKERLQAVLDRTFRAYLTREAEATIQKVRGAEQIREVFWRLQEEAIPEQAAVDAARHIALIFSDTPLWDAAQYTLDHLPNQQEQRALISQIGRGADRRLVRATSRQIEQLVSTTKSAIEKDLAFLLTTREGIARRLEADRQMEELLKEEASAAAASARRPLHRKQKRGGPKAARKQKAPESEKVEKPTKEPVEVADPKAVFLAKLQERRSNFRTAPRVQRWEKVCDVEEIRRFEDKKGVKHYADPEKVPKDDLHMHRAHHVLPGLDVIFSDKRGRQKYTFRTPTGLGMLVAFKRDGITLYGKVYFGIDCRIIYHRQFVPFKEQDTVDMLLKAEHKLEEQLPLEDDGWASETSYIFDIVEGDAIRVEYPGENSEVIVYSLEIGIRC